VAAGKAIGVRFGLGGSQGLGIFEGGSPTSQRIACDAFGLPDPVEETITIRAGRLSYKAEHDRYAYLWKTEPTWAGTCRLLNLRLNDGTNHVVYFSFR